MIMKKFTFLMLTIISMNISAQFTDITGTVPGFSFAVSAFGDADGDGDLDLYLSGMDNGYTISGGLFIYDATSESYTLSTTANIPAVYMGSADWGDIDGDGDLDIVIMGQNASYTDITEIYKNNNDGTFTAMNAGLEAAEQGEVKFCNLNNDSHLDVSISAISGAQNNPRITKLYKNDGNGALTELTSVSLPGMNYGRIKWADYDNDGDQDFVLSGYDDNGGGSGTFYTKIFTNNGNETFTDSGISLHQGWLGDTEWGDYNGDGNIDLVLSGTGGSGTDRFTLLYKNNGNGTFTELNPGFEAVSHSGLEWADFDNDGDLDLFLTGSTSAPGAGTGVTHIYINEGGDNFTDLSGLSLSTSAYGDVDSGDIDGDGKIDLVIAGYDNAFDPSSKIYKNDGSLNISTNIADSFSIYPNPTTGTIYVSNNGNQTYSVKIIDILGKTVLNKQNISATVKTIDLDNLKKGIYLIQIEQNDQLHTQKLILR